VGCGPPPAMLLRAMALRCGSALPAAASNFVLPHSALVCPAVHYPHPQNQSSTTKSTGYSSSISQNGRRQQQRVSGFGQLHKQNLLQANFAERSSSSSSSSSSSRGSSSSRSSNESRLRIAVDVDEGVCPSEHLPFQLADQKYTQTPSQLAWPFRSARAFPVRAE